MPDARDADEKTNWEVAVCGCWGKVNGETVQREAIAQKLERMDALKEKMSLVETKVVICCKMKKMRGKQLQVADQ